MSPAKDMVKRKEALRLRDAELRVKWLAMHPCDCGATATFMRSRAGKIPSVWRYSEQHRTEVLMAMDIEYACDECAQTRRDQAAAAALVREIARKKAARATAAKDRAVRKRSEAAAVPKRIEPVEKKPNPFTTLFVDVHKCRCGLTFPRHALLWRHQHADCPYLRFV